MEDIVSILKQKNKVIAIKTDTVYGLVCNANDEVAVKRIYDIKKRDGKKPISIFIKNKCELSKYVDESTLNEEKLRIIDKYWPGALTIIFKKRDNIYDYLTCGENTLGIRVPNDANLLKILYEVDFPLAETSCNLSGEQPYNNISVIKEKLGKNVDLIIDGGIITHNVASTVVSFVNDNIMLLRVGDVKISE